jgi:hypothetical protein
MFDCSTEVLAYHNDEVTLPQKERDEMRQRRDTNRTRVKSGLDKNDEPKPREFASQGSYAMKTMTQHSEKDYDIDDGIYFDKDQLINSDGTDMSALEARQMVRNAVDDGSFNRKPEVRENCVRIYYEAGYHVDIPVYRRVLSQDFLGNEQVHYELASNDWKRSDAREVTEWFDKENQSQSPDVTNGRQLRRITRETKKYSRSRSSWKGQIASGFMITKLVTECYRPDNNREDKAFYDTVKAIRDRLNVSLEVKHPVTANETISKGNNDPTPKFFRDQLSEALEWLSILFESECTRKQALSAWDKVFNTTYFSAQLDEEKSHVAAASVSATASHIVTPRATFGEEDE